MRTRSGKNIGANGLMDAASCPTPELQAITVRNQQDSPILRLPPEIRNRIFQHAVGGHNINIYYYNEWQNSSFRKIFGATSLRALSSSESVDSEEDEPGTPVARNRFFRCYVTSAAVPFRPWGDKGIHAPAEQQVPLTQAFLTCRQIYQETVLLLYTANIFSFDTYGAVVDWVKWLLPVQRLAVTAVVQPTAFEVEDVFYCLRGLKTIYLYEDWLNERPSGRSWSKEEKSESWHAKGITVKWICDSDGHTLHL